ncbi:IS5-like element ISGeob4 family transposase [Geodermatophilus obscurus]|uniref:Transposase IS4 family protein n=1 Tax=Geodermatophilus obscurus (strain ATCC 25078 / DSM 43160 / JCM 3152 / CCUG 61914 / KCC A-0152 / KCTC 9177 / NBRC 13315 / NRRL B-3577 / G-20) TaxID=526225 RepID=D2S851_GEOOG|nr:IS5-like element ISGeob4 family transposase [Geodermatophilus obscurus]ADB73473.1 transposase IS4 family protein [Geodermatophilus obscurus DSM 43160]
MLPVEEPTVQFVSALLAADRRRRRTRPKRRALGCYRQAVLVLRWFLDGTRLAQLAVDHRIGRSTAYRYLHEGIDVLAAAAPALRGALLAARAAGYAHVTVDGTLIRTDGCRTKNPDTGHDLWFSGKHKAHGGNVQIVSDPDGHPVVVSEVEPGSVHDLAAARATGFLGALHAAAALLGLPALAALAALADKGYHGAGIGVLTPTKGRGLHSNNLIRNRLIGCLRAPGERGIALLKTRWKALGRIRLCPQRIGAIAKAALVLTNAERPIR